MLTLFRYFDVVKVIINFKISIILNNPMFQFEGDVICIKYIDTNIIFTNVIMNFVNVNILILYCLMIELDYFLD